MVHPDDLDVFGRITGHRTLTPEFEEEYAIWLKMHHRNKRQGGLGDLMIPLLRSLGIMPKSEEIARQKIDWAKVDLGRRVIVNTDTGPREGSYAGLRDFGILAIRYDNDPMLRHANPHQVVFVEDGIQALPVAPPVKERIVEPQTAPTIADEPEEIEAYRPDRDDPDPMAGTKDAPKLENKEWYKRATGSTVYVQAGVDTAEGQLVSVGPEDGKLTVWLEGADEQQVFDEADVYAAD